MCFMNRFITLFLFLFIVLSGNIYSQDDILLKRVKYRAVNRDLSNVIVDLSKKSKVNIVFKITDIPEKNINLYAPDYTLKDILDYIIKGTNLIYDIVDKQIVIFIPNKEEKQEYTVKGYIRDVSTGEKLVYANIYLPDFTRGTISNEYGFFSMKLKKGDNKIVFSYLGYNSKTIDVSIKKDYDIIIGLQPKPDKLLNQVLIVDSKLKHKRLAFYEPERIDIDRVENMVHLVGEDDILRFTYVQPGVLTGADGFGGIHVRGGNSGDNMILLDGVPVYNAQHAIGLFSIFNSSVIKNSRFLKGNFPARYGGGLGSVLDIRTRDGNNKKFGGELDIGLLTVKGLFEGPIVDNKSSLLISFRRTYFDIWDKTISNLLSDAFKNKDFSYYFYDFNIKMNFKLNKRNRLFFSLYNGSDSFFNESKEYKSTLQDTLKAINSNEWLWGNTLLSAQWNHQPGKRIFINTSIFLSKYQLKSNSFDSNSLDSKFSNFIFNGRTMDSKVNDVGIKLDFDFSLNNNHYMKWGILSVLHNIEPFVFIRTNTLEKIPEDLPKVSDLRNEIKSYLNESYENRFYFEDKMVLGNSTNLNVGLHLAHFNTENQNYYSLEPRIIFNQGIGNSTIFSLSITRMSQFVHTLTNNGLGLPSEILLPSSEYLFPEKIWHFNTGFLFDLTKNLTLSAEVYYKNAKNIVEHKEGSYFIVSNDSDWENFIPAGVGHMYGFETQLKYNSSRWKFWLNYSYSKSERSYEHILDGEFFEYRFSRKHYFNFNSVYKITDNMNAYVTVVYGSGNPYTLPTQLTPDNQLVYEEKNNWKLPYYQRIDVGVQTKLKVKKIEQEFKFGIYNILNRSNPFYIEFNATQKTLLNSDFKEIYVFPFLPSISYKIKF